MPMFVTPLYAGLLALWFVLLSVRVVNLRRRGNPFGDNGDIEIKRIVRAQANFAEYVPLALLLMGFLEVTRYSIYLLHALQQFDAAHPRKPDVRQNEVDLPLM